LLEEAWTLLQDGEIEREDVARVIGDIPDGAFEDLPLME
jgi:hypothetical protein